MLYCVVSGVLKSLELLLKVKRTRHLADVVNAVVSTPNASPTRRSRVMSRAVTVTLYTPRDPESDSIRRADDPHGNPTLHPFFETEPLTSILLVILAHLPELPPG
jgi:hypothetical protein